MQRKGHENNRMRIFINIHRLASQILVRSKLQQLHDLHCSSLKDSIR